MAVTHPVATRDGMTNFIVDQLDSGTVEIQDSGGTEVATLTFGATAFDASGSAGGNADGVATANAITQDSSATGGTAAKVQLKTSGATAIVNGSVTATGGGGDVELSSVSIGAGAPVSMSALTYESAP